MRGTRKAKETEYRIFKEFNTKTDRDRVYLTAGHKIRVDIFKGYLWQVPELLRCKKLEDRRLMRQRRLQNVLHRHIASVAGCCRVHDMIKLL